MDANQVTRQPITVGAHSFECTCVSMGNPHCVIFVEKLDDELVLGCGPKLERHDLFPNRINVEFVEILSRSAVRMRVWERGSGETMACGSGAAAAAVAGVVNKRTDRSVVVHLNGGDLRIDWAHDGPVYMSGSATHVFDGTVDL